MGKLFGTDGIRGIAGEELTAELAFRLGIAVAHVLARSDRRTKVMIGKDTRLSGDMFEAAITAGLCASGSDVYLLGVVPCWLGNGMVEGFDACRCVSCEGYRCRCRSNDLRIAQSERI